jgi:hypothetical protein
MAGQSPSKHAPEAARRLLAPGAEQGFCVAAMLVRDALIC